MKVGIRLSAWLEIFDCGTCPAVWTATLSAQMKSSGSYPRRLQKIQIRPISPDMPAAKATRMPRMTAPSMNPDTIRPI